LHRTSLLTELICSLDSVLNTDTADKTARMTYMSTMMSFSKRAVLTIIIYLKESFLAYVSNSTFIVTVMIPALLCGGIDSICRKSTTSSTLPTSMPMAPFQDITGSQSFSTIVSETDSNTSKNISMTSSTPNTRTKSVKEVIKVMKKTLLEIRNVYAQPAKIALAVTITSFFVLLEQLQSRAKNSLWAVLVVVLVRQESTSSSFLTGYQRLEGTVVGAVYAFTMYQIFGCDTNQCGSNVSTPVLLFWLALCSFFRDGPRHGYAAIVAGFTPIVLFLGNTPSTAAGAWERVELTFTGIGIYLLIDNLIFPNRTDVALRAGVLKSIEVTRYYSLLLLLFVLCYYHLFICSLINSRHYLFVIFS
jgi:Fusaric acid resistance protein-like